MVAESPEQNINRGTSLLELLDEKSRANLEHVLENMKNFDLVKYLKTKIEHFKPENINFSSTIEELSQIKDLSSETEKKIIAVIKEKNKDNPQIQSIEGDNLHKFLQEAYASLGNTNETELSQESQKAIEQFNNLKILNNEIFPDYFQGNEQTDQTDLNKILNIQLNNQLKASKEAQEKAIAPLAHAFDISYHLLNTTKYPLSDQEIKTKFPQEAKHFAAIQNKITEKENAIDAENKKGESNGNSNEEPDENRISQLLQEIENLKRDYKIHQLPKELQSSAFGFFNHNLSEASGVKLFQFVADKTADDLIQFPAFSQYFDDANQFKSQRKKQEFKKFCQDLMHPQRNELTLGMEDTSPKISVEKVPSNKKDASPLNFKITNISKSLKDFIKAQAPFNIGDTLTAQDLVSIYLAWNSQSPELIEKYLDDTEEDLDDKFFQHHKEQEEAEEKIKEFEDKFKEKVGMEFEKGLKIWLPIVDSELPPFKDETKQRVRAEVIENNHDTFKVKINGGELKFKNFEDKEITLPKNTETFEKRSGMKVTKGNKFEEVSKQLEFGNHFQDIKWNGNRYERGDNNANNTGEVKYFAFTDDLDQQKYPILYEVEYLNGKVKLKTDFLQNDKHYNYEKEMEYDQFLLFLKTKNLQPTGNDLAETLKEAKKQKTLEYKSNPIRKRNRFSINSIKEGVKGLWKKMKDAMDAKDKKNADDFNDWLYDPSGGNILGILSKWGLFSSIKNRAKEEQMKQVIEGGKSRMGKINEYLKLMEEDGEYNSHVKGLAGYPNEVFGPAPLQALLGNADPGKATIDSVVELYDKSKTKKKLQTAAAVMLAQLSKGKALYRHFPQLEDQGAWVKILLGEQARLKFMEEKAKLQAQINQGGGDKKQLWDLMAKAEVSFICNTIRGDKRDFFSGIEGYKGLPEDFADKLESSYNEKHSANEADTEFGNSKHTSFITAKIDFEKKLKDGRFEDSVGQLKKLLSLAQTSKQHKETQAAFTALLLSGKIESFCGKKEKDQIISMARSYSFPPGLVIESPNFQSIILAFLDKIHPCPELKKAVKDRNRDAIIKLCNKRFLEHGNKFEEFCKHDLILLNWKSNPSINELKDKLLDSSDPSTDEAVMKNRNAKIHRGLNSNPAIVGELKSYRDGEFSKEPDASLFWKQVIADIEKFPPYSSGLEYLLYQRFNKFFDISDLDEINSVLLFLASHTKEQFQEQYGTDKETILKEYLQGTVLSYNSPPKLFLQVLNTFASKFTKGLDDIQNIIKNKYPKTPPLTRNEFEKILRYNAKNKQRITWDFKTKGIGYNILEAEQNKNKTTVTDDDWDLPMAA